MAFNAVTYGASKKMAAETAIGGGAIQGKAGKNGKDGVDGKSAYQIAVDNGYTGTESEWLESLKAQGVTDEQISNAVTAYLEDNPTSVDLSEYIKASVANDTYEVKGASYTKAESDAKYLTEHQSLDDYAKKAETYTKTETDAKIADVVTGGTVDLSNYVTKEQLQATNETIDYLDDHKANYLEIDRYVETIDGFFVLMMDGQLTDGETVLVGADDDDKPLCGVYKEGAGIEDADKIDLTGAVYYATIKDYDGSVAQGILTETGFKEFGSDVDLSKYLPVENVGLVWNKDTDPWREDGLVEVGDEYIQYYEIKKVVRKRQGWADVTTSEVIGEVYANTLYRDGNGVYYLYNSKTSMLEKVNMGDTAKSMSFYTLVYSGDSNAYEYWEENELPHLPTSSFFNTDRTIKQYFTSAGGVKMDLPALVVTHMSINTNSENTVEIGNTMYYVDENGNRTQVMKNFEAAIDDIYNTKGNQLLVDYFYTSNDLMEESKDMMWNGVKVMAMRFGRYPTLFSYNEDTQEFTHVNTYDDPVIITAGDKNNEGIGNFYAIVWQGGYFDLSGQTNKFKYIHKYFASEEEYNANKDSVFNGAFVYVDKTDTSSPFTGQALQDEIIMREEVIYEEFLSIEDYNGEEVLGVASPTAGFIPFVKPTTTTTSDAPAQNLVLYPYVSPNGYTHRGVTFTVNADKSITANGTNDGNGTSYFYVATRGSDNVNPLILDAGTYTFTGAPKDSGITANIVLGKNTIGNTNGERLGLDEGDGCTFTITERTKVQIRIQVGTGMTADNVTFKPMLVKGSVAHEYVSPEASYVSFEDIADMRHENLVSYPYQSGDTYGTTGITFTVNDDRSVTASGSNPDSYAHYNFRSRVDNDKNPLYLEAGEYTISGCPFGGSKDTYSICIHTNNENGSVKLIGQDFGEGFTFFLTDRTRIQVQAYIKQGQTATDLTFKPMLVKGRQPKVYQSPLDNYIKGSDPRFNVPDTNYVERVIGTYRGKTLYRFDFFDITIYQTNPNKALLEFPSTAKTIVDFNLLAGPADGSWTIGNGYVDPNNTLHAYCMPSRIEVRNSTISSNLVAHGYVEYTKD